MTSERARAEAIRLLEPFDNETADGLAVATRATLEHLGFEIRDAAPPQDGTGCSVSGSFHAGPPPVITVAADSSHARRRFTALHEFGHSLITGDTEIHDLLFEQADLGERMTEDICDAVAAEILLPATLTADHIGDRGPTARAVRDLYRASPASREAACVRACQLIKGEGHVMLAECGVARFCASRGTPYRVRRGTDQGAGHITALAAERGSARAMAPVVYPSGATSDRYHADAIADDGYVFAVFVADRPPWETTFTIPEADRTDPVEVECPHCEEAFTTMAAPCGSCGDYVHAGGCGRCSCSTVRERTCSVCFAKKASHLFATADSDICVDCPGG